MSARHGLRPFSRKKVLRRTAEWWAQWRALRDRLAKARGSQAMLWARRNAKAAPPEPVSRFKRRRLAARQADAQWRKGER